MYNIIISHIPKGTLLHFEDHGLKNIYFLDPQWLAKLMADVIRPAAVEEGSPIQNGQSANCLFTVFVFIYIVLLIQPTCMCELIVCLNIGIVGTVI